MAKLIHYYAHPGQQYSSANNAMWNAAQQIESVTRVDLYAEYPRHQIMIDKEQSRLLDHDVILFQFPLFWYSSPSLVKEWIDLTLEHGFAYGEGGDKLAGKWVLLAITTAGPEDAYSEKGYQNFSLRTFLTPFEQTARLSKMRFTAPYVFHDALRTDTDDHINGFKRLLTAIRDNRFDFEKAEAQEIMQFDSLPIIKGDK